MSTASLATIGDAVLRLSTDNFSQLASAKSLHLDVSGSEANVACHLARLGHKTRWCGCLPRSPLANRVTLPWREAGVDISATVWRDQGRVSSYYVEAANLPRESYVIYDRKDSCFEGLKADEIDWQELLDARLFHATGITAALSPDTLDLVTTGLVKSQEMDVLTSFDVNHRDLLWSPKQAKEVLLGLLPHVDLLICSLRDARKVFGIDNSPGDTALELQALSGAKWVVVSDGDRNVTGVDDGIKIDVAAQDACVADRIGAGDGLAAGVIHGLLSGDFEKGLRLGSALAALVLSVHGEQPDFCMEDLEKILSGATSNIRR